MKASVRTSLLAGVATTLALAACSSSNPKTEQAARDAQERGVAAIAPDSASSFSTRALLGDESWLAQAKPDKPFNFKKEHIDRLLSVLYRTDGYIDQFEAELDQMLKQAAANPNYDGDPLATDAYAEIQKSWALYGHAVTVISANYRELLQAKYDATSPERSQRATAMLNELQDSLRQLPPEDKIQLQILFREMAEVQSEFKTAAKDAAQKGREVASASVNFDDYVYNDYPRLKKDLKRYAKAMSRKTKKARSYTDPELQASNDHAADGRAPAARLVPDVGPDGNIIGSVFPNNTWTLTYDDGPKASTTTVLMDYLSQHRDVINSNGAPATFFWLAKNVKEYPSMVEKGRKLGFSLQNHSWSHANLAKANSATLQREIVDSTRLDNEVYGKPIKFFRCPYGACFAPKVPVVRKMLADMGLVHAYWAIDSLDWKLLNAERVFDLTVKEMRLRRRGVILMHDIHPTTVEASRLLLNYIKQQNNTGSQRIRLLTLDDAVDIVNAGGQ